MKEKLQCLQNKVARAIAFQRYDEANHQNILNGFELLNIRYLIDYDLGVLMYKTVNGHGPEICEESFHDISSLHEHATKSAVKGVPLYLEKQLALPSRQSQLLAQSYGT